MDSQTNNRIAKNAIFLYVRMFICLFISIYTSRVILQVLGVTDYGIYNVVSGVTTMVMFFSGSLTNVAQRYLNISLGTDDSKLSNQYFSQFQLIFSALSVLLLIIGLPFTNYVVEKLLVIPPDRITASQYVYVFSLISLSISFACIPYHSVIIAHEKMNVYAYITLFETVARLGVLYLVAVSSFDRLITYSFLILAISFANLAFAICYCCKHFFETHYRYYFNARLAKEMFSFLGYNVFGCFAFSIQQQGINVLLNIFFGPAVNAARAIAVQVNNSVIRFSDNLMVAFKPSIIKLYAQGNIQEMTKLAINAARYSIYVILIVIIPLLICINPILSIWLKVVPEYTSVFVILIMMEGVVNMLNQPITILVNATGNLKQNQFYGRLYSLCVLPIAYLMLLLVHSPIVPLIIGIVGTICYFMNNLFDVKKQLGISVLGFVKRVILPCVIYIPVAILSYVLYRGISGQILQISVVFSVSILTSSSITYIFLLESAEKRYVQRILHRLVKYNGSVTNREGNA